MPGEMPIHLQVTLSPAAQRALAENGEDVMVSADWYGWPTRQDSEYANEIGAIDLGQAVIEMPLSHPTTRVSPPPWKAWKLKMLKNGIYANVNVYSTRRHGPDNLLACDFADGLLGELTGHVIPVHCSLIRENLPTRQIAH
ncbi:hypothetical protein DDE05_24580 [Streptomyces cavourensis]|nr:hypothetical protein DDE05_24580 [Streptomyces cavourensis]